jgi:predicted AlkP superfamily pyrophosphatase or phosphodiesterase
MKNIWLIPLTLLLLHATLSSGAKPKHIVTIVVKGLGEVFLSNSTDLLPTINEVLGEGSHTEELRSRNKATEFPNLGCIITGMSPESSGIRDDTWTPEDTDPDLTELKMPPISGKGEIPPPLWHVMKQQDQTLVIGIAVNSMFVPYFITSHLDFQNIPRFNNVFNDQELLQNVILPHIKQDKPNFYFIVFASLQNAADLFNYGSSQYYDALLQIDTYIAQIIQALKEANIYNDTLLIITSDHGNSFFYLFSNN